MHYFAVVIVLCGVSISLIVLGAQGDHGPSREVHNIPSVRDTGVRNRPLVIRSFSYTSYNEHGINNTLEGDKLQIKPRRFMAFNIKSINEAVVNNARLAIFTRKDEVSEPQYFGFENVTPLMDEEKGGGGRSKALGLVTRMIFRTMEMDLLRDNKKIIKLVAETGLIEKKKEGLNAFNAILTDVRTCRRITTRKLLWNGKRKVFRIPGPYRMSSSSGDVSGRSVEVDLDFEITPLSS